MENGIVLENSLESTSTESDSASSHAQISDSRRYNSRADNQHVSFTLDDYNIDSKVTLDSALTAHSVIPDSLTPFHNSKFESSDGSDHDRGIAKEEVGPSGGGSLTRRQLLIFLVYGFTEFFSAAVVSLQSPFYPAEAEKKGVTASEYGLVFGVFELTVFIVSFAYGKYMSLIGPKFVFNLGLFTTGVCSIFFGMLDQIEDRTTFFALSMVTRIVEATAAAGYMNAVFVIIALEFPNSVATTFGTVETIFGVGLTCGPLLGAALFELGGFSLPFVSVGVLLVLTSVFTFFVLPTPVDSGEEHSDPRGLLHLIRIPEIGISTFSIFATAISIGYIAATLEPHIRVFGLNYISVGGVIVITGGTYALMAPIWGRLCDRMPSLKLYMLIGSVLIISGFILVGPAPFLPFDTILWVTCLGLVLHGIGTGGCLVPSFIQSLSSANEHGFPNNVATFSYVSCLFSSSFSLGNFIGPTISGILYDLVGFRNGTLFVIGLHTIVVIVLLFMLIGSRKKDNKNLASPTMEKERLAFESDPLLGTSKAYKRTRD